ARAHARRFRPDFVFLSKCLALDPETVESIIGGKANAMWYHDPQWYRDLDRPDIGHVATIGRLAHTFFVTGFDAEWRANGLPALFLPAAGDAEIEPVKPVVEFASDVAFIGSGYDADRAKLLVRVAQAHNLRVWGPGWDQWKTALDWSGRPVEKKEFAQVCSSSKVVLGINPSRAAGGVSYTSDRTWMVMLAGGFYLTEYRAGVASMLKDGEHCAFYSDAESCISQTGRYLADTVSRNRIKADGEAFVRAHHTYDQRIANLLENREFVNPL
ncbi:MAG: glycosyltransferase family protein, partial [Thermoanaerobaculia bacterium]